LPRSIDDAKPYYMFNADTIAQSGAINVEDFLRQRLTMMSGSQAPSQNAPINGNYADTSSLSLRGLGGSTQTAIIGAAGASQTLVLVNGRRMAGYIVSGSNNLQPD